MKFQTQSSENATFVGGSLVGYIEATRKELEEVFGKPTYDTPSSDGKTLTEWVVTFEDGTTATIYDYKRYEEGKVGLHETYDWHIGGQSEKSVELVKETMSEHGNQITMVLDVIQEMKNSGHFDNYTLEELAQRIV